MCRLVNDFHLPVRSLYMSLFIFNNVLNILCVQNSVQWTSACSFYLLFLFIPYSSRALYAICLCIKTIRFSVPDKIGNFEMLSGHVLNPSPFKISQGNRGHLLLDFLSTLAFLPATLSGRTNQISFMPACITNVSLMFFWIAWPRQLTFASLRASRWIINCKLAEAFPYIFVDTVYSKE